MEGHYFDIETYSAGEKPDSKTDKIISIQFQKIDLETGKPLGNLQILKEWEESEEEIVKFIHKWFFNNRNPWQFIPVGFNLLFEWQFLSEKFKQYNLANIQTGEFLEKYPQIDLKPLAIIKKGTFIGASLSSISNKQEDGNIIKEYYENKDFEKINQYIKDEAQSFIELYQKSVDILEKL